MFQFSKNELAVNANSISFNSSDTSFRALDLNIIKGQQNQFDFSAVNIHQLHLQKFIHSNELIATNITISKPSLTLEQLMPRQKKQNQLKSEIIKKVTSNMDRVHVDKFILDGGEISYRKNGPSARKSYTLDADSVSLTFHDFNIDSTSLRDTNSIFFSEFVFVGAKKISYIKDDQTKLYVDNFETSSLDTNLFLQKVLYSKGDEIKKLGTQ